MQVLVENQIYVFHVEMPMSIGDAEYRGGVVLGDRYKLVVIIPRRVFSYPQKRITERLKSQKNDGSIILVSLTNRSHQVHPRSLLGPCFAVVCKMKHVNQC